MRISLLQYPIIWADKTANLTLWQQRLNELKGTTDIAILPEMFTTGFCTDRMDLAETMNDNTVTWLKHTSAETGLALIGSFLAAEGDKRYNRAFFVTPDGKMDYADKRHLFTMGGEREYLSEGNKSLIVHYMGVNIKILVCYDLRFPVWARNRNNEYDLLIYVANWPQARIADWDILLPARAVENQAYVCGVNRVGDAPGDLHYNGHSLIIDPRGRVVEKLLDDQEGTLTTTIDLTLVEKGRTKFPVWKDADQFNIITP